jgi:hypothetical protein
MTFNPNDYSKAPWTPECMTLSNDECVEVKTKCQKIVDDFIPNNYYPEPNSFYVISTYNEMDWNKAINDLTYNTLQGYNVEFNTQGISPDYPDSNFIVPEPEQPEQPTEEPTEEAPVEEQPVEQPTVEEEPTEEV